MFKKKISLIGICLISAIFYSCSPDARTPLEPNSETNSLEKRSIQDYKNSGILYKSRLAFELNGNIYSMYPDGSDLQQLTFLAAEESRCYWSQDGEKILFTQTNDIFLMNWDGSNQQQILGSSFGIIAPALSPDNNWIAYAYTNEVDGWSLKKIRTDGTEETTLISESTGFFEEPDWSPDGNRIVFMGQVNLGEPSPINIYTINPNGTNLEKLTFEEDSDWAVQPDWSPSGKYIAYIVGHQNAIEQSSAVFIMRANGKYKTQITDFNFGANHEDGNFDWEPTWAPDNKHLAFVSHKRQGGGIFIIQEDFSITKVSNLTPRFLTWGLLPE